MFWRNIQKIDLKNLTFKYATHMSLATTPSPAPVDTDSSEMSNQIQSVLHALGNFRSQITAIQNQVRQLEKTFTKEVRQHKRAANKQKARAPRKPSGFAKPSKISDDLAVFMNREKGTEVARTEVTQHLIQYIKENNCQDPTNKKLIKPDQKLKSLLNVTDQDEVTFFSLQKLMNCHFPKASSTTQ